MSVPCLQNRVATILLDMPDVVRSSAEAVLALALAAEIDAGRQLSIAPVSKELRTVLELLRSWAAAGTETGDAVDDLSAARAARLANTAG